MSRLSLSLFLSLWSFYFQSCWQSATETFHRGLMTLWLGLHVFCRPPNRISPTWSWSSACDKLWQVCKHLKGEESKVACAFEIIWGSLRIPCNAISAVLFCMAGWPWKYDFKEAVGHVTNQRSCSRVVVWCIFVISHSWLAKWRAALKVFQCKKRWSGYLQHQQ